MSAGIGATRSVLGIDAAWTEGGSSGVALVAETTKGWRCIAVEPSYRKFVNLPGVSDHLNGATSAAALIKVAKDLAGIRPTVLTVDMPLATVPITGRRVADQEVSKFFGGCGCGTHSPTADRPGRVGTTLRKCAKGEGYPLAVASTKPGTHKRLVEVYPHPALLRLLGVAERVKYKVTKTPRYWPDCGSEDRRRKVVGVLAEILKALSQHIEGIPIGPEEFDSVKTFNGLKPHEDKVDALICAWVGVRYLERDALPYGDETAAIWVPATGLPQGLKPPAIWSASGTAEAVPSPFCRKARGGA